jgi:apolipoprotein D and lipocalin family protein
VNVTALRLGAGLLAVLLLATAAGCTTRVPEGIEPVRGFEVQRYMGTWYEIARLDHRFERGMDKVTATYALRPDGTVSVLNKGFVTRENEWRDAEGVARFVGASDVAALKVSFFGPFYGGYNVVDLDPAYQHALVAGPDRSYLWILSRSPQPPRSEVDRLVAKARSLGFDTDALIFVEH